jgi:hypothetical protein
MSRRFCLFLLAAVALADIAPPRIGYIVDRSGSLRPINGVAGAFTIGDAIEKEVVSAAFSGRTLVVKKDHELIVDGKAFEAPAGSAVVKFDSKGLLEQVFFPNDGQLWTARDGDFERSLAAGIDVVATVRESRLFLRSVEVPLRSAAINVSQMGEGWLVIYAQSAIYALHDEQIFELPEDAE